MKNNDPLMITLEKHMTVETEIAINWINEKGWFCSKSKDVILNVENIVQHYNVVGEMTDNRPVCFLVWPNFSSSASMEVRQKLDKIMPQYTKCIAMITENVMMKIGVSLFYKIAKNPVPIKVFSNEEKAIEWLIEMDENI